MANHKVTIRYGELDLEVHVYVEPAEPQNGTGMLIDIEEIHLTRQYFNRDGVELDTGFDDFIYDRYDKDQMFAMALQDQVRKELEEGARQRVEDVDYYPRMVCTRPCIDRRAV
ncbi:MAG TPA: hypothetical protein PKO27_17775 [Deltaproteobacteria bacterium]|nr:hypothetical protein [Deltaproteobacteria bacterium]